MDHNRNGQKDNEVLFKILIIGDVAVGKSSIMKRFAENVFDPRHGSTIGVDFKTKKISLRDKSIKLQIWDTGWSNVYAEIHIEDSHKPRIKLTTQGCNSVDI